MYLAILQRYFNVDGLTQTRKPASCEFRGRLSIFAAYSRLKEFVYMDTQTP